MAGYVGTKAVLLSTTAANVGGAASVGAGLTVDNDGSTVLTVDRATSDGTVIDVQKSGSSVGSIGNRDADDIFINTAGGTGSLSVGGTQYYAWSSGAIYPWTDNASNLGASSNRWDDLYLSGGVYLGGTGAANKLDDYEEGTFTPVLSGYTSVAGTMSGKYTKIGNMVFCEVVMVITALTYNGNSRITGWPFTPSGTINNHPGQGTIGTGTALNVDAHLYHMGFYAQTANLYLYNKDSGGALSGNNYQVGTLGIKVAYKTNS